MYTYENARRKPKTAKKSRAAKPAKRVKPPKPKKPAKKNPVELVNVVVLDTKKGEIARFKLPGNQYALMRNLEPEFDDETVRLWGEVRALGVDGKPKFVQADWPTDTLTFMVEKASYYPLARNPYHVTPKGTAFYLKPGEIGDPDTRGAQKARRILRSEGIDQPLAGYNIRKVGSQYKIIAPDGSDTGKYGLSEESAERLLAKHSRSSRR